MNTTTQTTEASPVHPFQARGLGLAPFRYVGPVVQDLCYGEAILNREEYQKTGVRLTTAPGGSCAYCGTYIVNMFDVQSADGNTFHVGSDCIEKVYGKDHPVTATVRRVVSEKTKEQTAARTAAKLAELDAAMKSPEVLAVLKSKPHPSHFSNKTLLDFVHWMLNHSGTAGKLKTATVVARAMLPADACQYCGKPTACGAWRPCRGLKAVWAREERRIQRCENEEARRFEDRAYGRD